MQDRFVPPSPPIASGWAPGPASSRRSGSDPRGWLIGAARRGAAPQVTERDCAASREHPGRDIELRREQRGMRKDRRAGRDADASIGSRAQRRRRAGLTEAAAALPAHLHRARSPRGCATRWPRTGRSSSGSRSSGRITSPCPSTRSRCWGSPARFEREAIRPNVLGNFTDLLLAVEHHPAMLLYLDNHLSVGPNSRAAQVAGAPAGRAPGRHQREPRARDSRAAHARRRRRLHADRT